MKTLITCLAASLLLAVAARAQSYSIDWYKIAGGGGTSTGGTYSVSGTIGQADAGTMSGGNYTLQGGFWSVVAAVPVPGAPLLTITLVSPTSVRVSWPSPSTGFNLQQDSTVGNTNWLSWGGSPPSDDGTTKSILVNPPAGTLFFRLKK